MIRLIECPQCRAWEQMVPDEQRWHSQSFIWVQNTGDEAIYRCPDCMVLTISTTIFEADKGERAIMPGPKGTPLFLLLHLENGLVYKNSIFFTKSDAQKEMFEWVSDYDEDLTMEEVEECCEHGYFEAESGEASIFIETNFVRIFGEDYDN